MRSYQKVDEFCLPHSLTMRDDNVALGRPVARPRLNGMSADAQGFDVHGSTNLQILSPGGALGTARFPRLPASGVRSPRKMCRPRQGLRRRKTSH